MGNGGATLIALTRRHWWGTVLSLYLLVSEGWCLLKGSGPLEANGNFVVVGVVKTSEEKKNQERRKCKIRNTPIYIFRGELALLSSLISPKCFN